MECLKLHIHGLINHGMKLCQLYGSYDHWPHGADFVVSVLHDHLSTLKQQIEPSKWPHTLYPSS